MVANTKAAVAHPSQIFRLALCASDTTHNRGNFADHFRRQQLLDFLRVVHPVIHQLKCPGYDHAQSQTDAQSHAAELQAIGKFGLLRESSADQSMRNRSPCCSSSMLVAIFDSFFFFRQIVVVRFGLVVAAGQIGQLLLADRFLIQARLIVVDLRLQAAMECSRLVISS